jgi:hypothetical protein
VRAGLIGPPVTDVGFDYLLPMTKVKLVSAEASYFASPAANVALSVYEAGFRTSLMFADSFPVESVVPTAVGCPAGT